MQGVCRQGQVFIVEGKTEHLMSRDVGRVRTEAREPNDTQQIFQTSFLLEFYVLCAHDYPQCFVALFSLSFFLSVLIFILYILFLSSVLLFFSIFFLPSSFISLDFLNFPFPNSLFLFLSFLLSLLLPCDSKLSFLLSFYFLLLLLFFKAFFDFKYSFFLKFLADNPKLSNIKHGLYLYE